MLLSYIKNCVKNHPLPYIESFSTFPANQGQMIMIMLCLDNPPTRINFLFFLSLSEHVSWHVVGWARKEETSKLFSFLLPCLIQILRWNHFLKPTKAIAAKVLSPIVIRSEISGHSNANAAPDAKFICGKIKQRSFGNNRPNGNC